MVSLRSSPRPASLGASFGRAAPTYDTVAATPVRFDPSTSGALRCRDRCR